MMFTRYKGYWISIENKSNKLRIQIGKNGDIQILETLQLHKEEEGLSIAITQIDKNRQSHKEH